MEDNTNGKTCSDSSRLRSHALERLMERTSRAPSWLDVVVSGNQFAHLKLAKVSRKRYVLVFDPLANAYIVPVLGAGANAVITVLTRAQYERNHGTIPPVILQLAQMARTQSVAPSCDTPTSTPTAEALSESKKQSMWESRWTITLKFASRTHAMARLKIRLDTPWRHQLMLDAFQKTPLPRGGVSRALDLDFSAQAHLLAECPGFLQWLVDRAGLELQYLTKVTVVSSRSGNEREDLTPALIAQLNRLATA